MEVSLASQNKRFCWRVSWICGRTGLALGGFRRSSPTSKMNSGRNGHYIGDGRQLLYQLVLPISKRVDFTHILHSFIIVWSFGLSKLVNKLLVLSYSYRMRLWSWGDNNCIMINSVVTT